MSTLKSTLRTLAVFFFVSVLVACSGGDDDDPNLNPGGGGGTTGELEDLPEDTGGTHTPILRSASTAFQFGYYEYLPGGYASGTKNYPLLVFLHGASERGDGTTKVKLDKVLANGPPKLIEAGTWDPKYPMIVISPQFYKIASDDSENNWGGGKPAYLKAFIEYLIATYRVDESRIYLTGLSHGGNGVYDYVLGQSETLTHLAAAAPVAAYGYDKNLERAKNTPIWVFVGEDDGNASGNFFASRKFTTKYNAQIPAPKYEAKFTTFENAGHDVWTRVYSGSGIGTASSAEADYDPFDKPLYDWFFEYKRE